MGTMTAQLLIGGGHLYHGGITPGHYLYLSENSRPALILLPQNISEDSGSKGKGKITWIPTVDNMLEDALLMIAVHVIRDKEVRRLAGEYIKDLDSNRLELYSSISAEDREKLYRLQGIQRLNTRLYSVFLKNLHYYPSLRF